MSKQRSVSGQVAVFESEITRSRDGVQFDAKQPIWKIVNPVASFRFNIGEIYDLVGPETGDAIRRLLKYYVKNDSASHAHNIYNNLIYFLRHQFPNGGEHLISSLNILNYSSSLRTDQQYFIGVLSGFFKRWHQTGLPGIDGSVEKHFRDKKIKGNKKGEAVRNMNPETGPLTDLEQQAILNAVRKSFAEDGIGIEEYSLIILFSVIGCRSVSIASLKCKDLSVVSTMDGQKQFLLKLPRAKQRTTLVRQLFKDKYLLPEFGEIVEAQIRNAKSAYRANVGSDAELGECPMYPTFHRRAVFSPGFEFHKKPEALYRVVKNTVDYLHVLSERTGEPINIYPRRWRYTMGTRAAEEGHSELVIAEMLDHTDTQQVGVYTEATPSYVRRIDEAIALDMAPFAQAFMGVLVRDEREAVRGEDPASRIIDPNVGGVGTCGKYGFCGLAAPAACYQCHNFQPWLEADHHGLLQKLIGERNRREERTGGDPRMTNLLDRTILAVAEVVERCEVAKDTAFMANLKC